MANELLSPVFKLDTANTSTDLIANTLFRPLSVRWVGANTAGHVAEIRDSANNTVWKGIALGNNHSEESKPAVRWQGLVMHTLGSGVVYIEHNG
jgi:hypothetical protein